MQTHSEENYLKTILKLSRDGDYKISVKLVAASLGNNPASVIDMIKKLKEKGLVGYEKSKGMNLTEEGLKSALSIVRKHRLWEVFLKDKLEYDWAEVHEIAEQLEHIKQSELADRLDKFLGFPEYDPHGDPIPKADGKFPNTSKQTLLEIGKLETCRVVAVKDTSNEFLSYLQLLGIGINTHLKVNDKIGFDESIVIEIDKKRVTTVSKKFAENVMVL